LHPEVATVSREGKAKTQFPERHGVDSVPSIAYLKRR
jgi:hypothetical protein